MTALRSSTTFLYSSNALEGWSDIPGEMIARINPDSTWSVKWPEVIHQAYQPQTDLNIAVRAV